MQPWHLLTNHIYAIEEIISPYYMVHNASSLDGMGVSDRKIR